MRILLFVFSIMLPFVVPEAEAVSPATKSYGGTLNWGTRNKPTIINPILTSYSVSASLVQIIFNGLVRLNSTGEIEPDLAERWDISKSGLVYTFYLRQGIKFHDGVECTAEDVKFTYDKIIDPKVNSPFKLQYQIVERFEVVDRYTFKVVLNKSSVPFLYRMLRYVMPRHILEQTDLDKADFNHYPIGTGPFRFKQWDEDNMITLEYNPDYYEGRPYLDKVIIRAYSNSRDAWIAFMRGEVDYVELIEREDYEIIKDDPSFKSHAFPIDCYYAISYNMSDPILADKNIRQAIAYGIDRKELIKKAAFGYGLECNGPFSSNSIGFNPDVKTFEYNPEKSLELLDQAGWYDIDNDGILEKQGKELEIRVLVDSRSDIYNRIILAIRQELQNIGIKIRVVSYDHEDVLTSEFLEQNKLQAQLMLFLAGMDPDQTVEPWCSKRSKGIANKLWTYKNEEIDRLVDLGEVSQDKEKRQEFYEEIHELIYGDQPACFLYFPFYFQAASNRFENVDEFFNVNMPYYTMKDWHIERR
ncbi:ABC transporter substrate-binding protein [Candidatus Omnitrophota bacterium]